MNPPLPQIALPEPTVAVGRRGEEPDGAALQVRKTFQPLRGGQPRGGAHWRWWPGLHLYPVTIGNRVRNAIPNIRSLRTESGEQTFFAGDFEHPAEE